MAAANVLTIGTGAADSADITVTANTIFSLKGHDSSSVVIVQVKSDLGTYIPVTTLNWGQSSWSVLTPAVFRFSRPANSSSCGVFSG